MPWPKSKGTWSGRSNRNGVGRYAVARCRAVRAWLLTSDQISVATRAAACGRARRRMAWTMIARPSASLKTRPSNSSQMIVQAAVDFPFVNQVGRSRGDENVGILPLMIVGSVGIGQQQSGRRGGRKLGQRRPARTADGQAAAGQQLWQVRPKGFDPGLQGELAIQLARRFHVGLARLVQDLPTAQQVADFVQRPRDVLVQRSGSATASEHDQAGSWTVLWCSRPDCRRQARRLHHLGLDAADRIAGPADGAAPAELFLGFRETRAEQAGISRQPAIGLARHDVLLQQDQRQAAARGGPAHGHAGVSAQADDAGHVLFIQQTAGGKITGHVFHDEGDCLAGPSRQRPAGQRHIVEPRGRNVPALQRLAGADEGDPQARAIGRQFLRDGQAGEQMPARAASGKNDM